MNTESIILKAWEDRAEINQKSDPTIIKAIFDTLENLDAGKIRVAEKKKWLLAYTSMDKKSNSFKF